MPLFGELKRRNVFRVAMAYIVTSWLIIQVVDTISPAFGFGREAVRVVVIVLASAFIPALVFSWIFEITPEGLKREVDVSREQSITRFTGRKLDRFILVLLALAVGYFAFDKFVLDPAEDIRIAESAHQEGRTEAMIETYGDRSIAVLPFVNMSSDPEQEYFADGLSEELLNLLARIPELRVISRSSAFSFKGKQVDVPTIAAQLNVAHVLEGSVRKDGEQIRVTAQLIEAATDRHLWSETYDRTLDSIFAIQDEITAEIVNQLKITLLDAPPTVDETDSEAYSLFLQARHLWRSGTEEGVDKAYQLIRQALEIDPNYAPAWTGLGMVYTLQASLGQVPFEEGYQKAREASVRALDVDPDNALALSDLGWYAMSLDKDYVAAAGYFRAAVLNAPHDSAALGNEATFAAVIGRLDESIKLMRQAIKVDPVDSSKYTNLGAFYLALGDLDGAEAAFGKALEFSPDDLWTRTGLVQLRVLQERPDEALQLVQDLDYEPTRLVMLPLIYEKLGRADESQQALEELLGKAGTEVPYYDVAEMYAGMGRVDEAFEALELSRQNSEEMSFILTSAFLGTLHGDPRFDEFLLSLGLADEQLDGLELSGDLDG